MFGPDNGSLRTNRWRYIHYSDGSEELYDLRENANEWVNLAGQASQRATLDSLRELLAPYLTPKVER
jgi:hypothetical protein